MINQGIKQYKFIRLDIKNVPERYRKEISQIDDFIVQRLARLYTLKSGLDESEAESKYRECRFLSSISDYDTALKILSNSGIEHKIIDDYKTMLEKKRDLAFETGKAWLLNRVVSSCNQAEYLNIREKGEEVENILNNLKYVMAYNKILLTDSASNIYNTTCAKLKYPYKEKDINNYSNEFNKKYYGTCALVFDSLWFITLGCGIVFNILYNETYSDYENIYDKYKAATDFNLATKLHHDVSEKKEEANTYSIMAIVFYSISAAAIIPAIYFTYKYFFYKNLKKKMEYGSVAFNILYKNGFETAFRDYNIPRDTTLGAYVVYRF